jgi:hypothetical protein
MEPTTEQRNTSFVWLKGFADVLLSPQQLVGTLGSHAGKVSTMALLIATAASVLTNWFYATSPALRQQMVRLAEQRLDAYIAKHSELTDEQRQELRRHVREGLQFGLVRSIAGGIGANAIAFLSLMGLLWLLQPVMGVRWSALRFAVLVTAFSYATLWGSVGEVVSAAMQALGQSLRVQPSLAALVSPEADPVLFATLSRVHGGALVQYGVVGFLLARAAAVPLWRGVLWSVAAWCLWLAAIYGMGRLAA